MMSPVIIEDYDPLWPERFQILCAPIAAALGRLAGAIEHVGSTAVPGLAAKPIIDVDVLLQSGNDLPFVVRILESLGYHHEGDLGIPEREVLRPPAGSLPHHLYVCQPGSEQYKCHIAFRDYLRIHPGDAHAYALLKRRLAARFGSDRDAYTQAKSEFVEEILGRVESISVEHSIRHERTII